MITKTNSTTVIYAGIVTYNPEIKRFEENLTSVAHQVSGVIIVDNCSKNIEQIKKILLHFDNVSLIQNDCNEGIAKALNQIMSGAMERGVKWVLTLDQDSVVIGQLINKYRMYLDLPNVGMISCILKDRNAKGITETQTHDDYEIITRCFTSGCLTNVDAWDKCGHFDEKMFIDYVDYDMCLTMQENGYRIIRVNYEGLLHELGYSKNVKFLGKSFVISNHSAFRKYYIVRNRLYYIKKHSKTLDILAERRHLCGFVVLTLVKESNKFENLKAMVRGVIDYKKM